jgi:hypothetical protein
MMMYFPSSSLEREYISLEGCGIATKAKPTPQMKGFVA